MGRGSSAISHSWGCHDLAPANPARRGDRLAHHCPGTASPGSSPGAALALCQLRSDLAAMWSRVMTCTEQAVTLTSRELDCLRLYAAGMTSKAVARRLGIGPETVRKYLKEARYKLGAATMAHAVGEGFRRGLIT
jgi:DNA-binding CsgD family transcriptional regulator